MKILNLIWKFTTGGIGKCFLSYAQCSNIDNDIDIVSTCIDPQSFNYDRSALISNNIHIISIKNRKDFSWIKKTYEYIKETQPDIIFTHGTYGAIIIEILKLRYSTIRKIPLVVSFHGLYNPPTRKTALLTTPLNKITAWICKYRADKVVVVSKFAGEYLLKNGVNQQKLEVVYNGLPQHSQCDSDIKLPKDIIKIGFVGRIDEIKGLEYLLEALYNLKERISLPFCLYIIGDGPHTPHLKKTVKEFNLERNVNFVGYQSNITSWLNAWDIFVLPSLQENHSVALLEAMRAGKAIICTNVGGNPETVTHEKEALIVPSKDAQSIENALYRLINSQELRDTIGTNAHKRFISFFTEEQTLKSLIEVFKNLKNGL